MNSSKFYLQTLVASFAPLSLEGLLSCAARISQLGLPTFHLEVSVARFKSLLAAFSVFQVTTGDSIVPKAVAADDPSRARCLRFQVNSGEGTLGTLLLL